MSDDFDPDAIRKISLIPAAPPDSSTDAWGNIRGAPIGGIEECHGDWFVKISVCCVDGRYYYGYQLKVGTKIKKKAANINDRSFTTAELARSSASIESERVCGRNKNVNKLLADFIRRRYNQGSLFEGACNE
jgi:hypothetical protein